MKSRGTMLPEDELDAIVAEARRELSSTEARISQLQRRALAIATDAARDQAEVQRFLEEFALEPAVLRGANQSADRGTGPLFDIEAMRADTQKLNADVARSSALAANLMTLLQMLQAGTDQLSPDQAFEQVRDTADFRLQQAMSSAREEERRRLAREIHDGPAQVLSNAILAIYTAEQVAKRAPAHVPEALTEVAKLLKDGVAEVRRFMFDLRPAMLQDLGLGPTLSRYVSDYSTFHARQVGLTCADPLPDLTPEQELHMFRIVQESLQNFLKHAGPGTRATVQLSQEGSHLILTIADDGRGFDTDAVVPRPGHGGGLPGMRERAKLTGAELTVTSAVGQGTTVRLKMRLRGHTEPLGSTSASAPQ